jgi:type IV pilus assembly protein PilE
MPDHRPLTRPRRGFTLLELMVTLAVAAILAMVAWPSFQGAMQKGRRADGMAALSTLMQAQERYRSSHASYQSDLTALPGAGTVSGEGLSSPDGQYLVTLVADSVSASGYTARATAASGSQQYADQRCRVLQVRLAGGAITYSSIDASGSTNGTPDPCWVK